MDMSVNWPKHKSPEETSRRGCFADDVRRQCLYLDDCLGFGEGGFAIL